MSYNISEAKAELAAMLHGTSLFQVENITGVLNRAARQLLLDIDPQETKRIAHMNSPVYYKVFNYAVPSDIKGNKVIDLIPLQQSYRRDIIYSTYNQAFDVNKNASTVNECSVISDTGNKYLRVAYNNQSLTAVLDQVTSITGNGTWVASGTASNILENGQITNNQNNVLTFDATTGTAVLTNSTLQPVDLSKHFNQGCNFFTLYLDNSSLFTSATIKIGSDASNYYVSSALTTQFNGFAVNQGYNQFGQTFDDMTKVGNPDLSSIKYVQISVVFTGNIYNVGFMQIQNSLGFLFDMEYYSKFLFSSSSTGAWQEKVLTDSDLINLDTESYNLYLYQVAFLCVQQALGQDAGYDTNVFLDKYNEALVRYKRQYKSELQKVQNKYYTRTFNGYNGILGRGYNQPY